jgi:hypothetical protein
MVAKPAFAGFLCITGLKPCLDVCEDIDIIRARRIVDREKAIDPNFRNRMWEPHEMKVIEVANAECNYFKGKWDGK